MVGGTLNRCLLALIAACAFATPVIGIAYDWRQFNGDPAHSGNNTAETAITRANVTTLALAFQIALPDVADGAPAVSFTTQRRSAST